MNFQANSALLPEEDRVGGHRCGLDNSTVLARQIEAHLTATMQSSADDFGEQTDYALPKVMERDEVDLQRFAEFITGDDSWRTDNIEFAQPQQFDVFNDILLNTPAHGGSPTVAPQAYEPTRTTGVDTSGFAHSFTVSSARIGIILDLSANAAAGDQELLQRYASQLRLHQFPAAIQRSS